MDESARFVPGQRVWFVPVEGGRREGTYVRYVPDKFHWLTPVKPGHEVDSNGLHYGLFEGLVHEIYEIYELGEGDEMDDGEPIQQPLFDFEELTSGVTPEPTRHVAKRRVVEGDQVEVAWPLDACAGSRPTNFEWRGAQYGGRNTAGHRLVMHPSGDVYYVPTLEMVRFVSSPSSPGPEVSVSPFHISQYRKDES